MNGYVTIGVLLVVGVVLIAGAGALNSLLSPSRPAGSEGFTTYESGVDPVGEGWAQSQIRYYVYAFLYVIFAVETVFLYPVGHHLCGPGLRSDGAGGDGRLRRPAWPGAALCLAQARPELHLTAACACRRKSVDRALPC